MRRRQRDSGAGPLRGTLRQGWGEERDNPDGGDHRDVIAPGELFSETNDNSVAILLSYGTARVLLAGDAEAREEEYMGSGATRGLKRSSTFRNYTHSEPRFRALLTEGMHELDLALCNMLR